MFDLDRNTGYDLDYTYDPTNGHQVSSIAVTSYRGVTDDAPRRTRSMHYAYDDNGYVSNYLYDASGERTLKLSGAGSGMFVNGLLSGGETRFTEYTVYVSPYVVINGGGQLSKHIYMGSQRIVSKLCSAGSIRYGTIVIDADTKKRSNLSTTEKRKRLQKH